MFYLISNFNIHRHRPVGSLKPKYGKEKPARRNGSAWKIWLLGVDRISLGMNTVFLNTDALKRRFSSWSLIEVYRKIAMKIFFFAFTRRHETSSSNNVMLCLDGELKK